MFTHIMIGSNNLERSRAFYDATFMALGGKPSERDDRGRLIYDHDGGRLMIIRPIDGHPATVANGGTIGIAAINADHVRAWHEAGTAHGTRPAPRIAAPQSKPHRASAQTASSLPISAIRTATS